MSNAKPTVGDRRLRPKGWVSLRSTHPTRWRRVDHAWGISGVNYEAAFRDILCGVVLLASDRGTPD